MAHDKDTAAKAFFAQNDVFADLFNFEIFGGEQVIKPDELTPLDTVEAWSDSKWGSEQRARDSVRRWASRRYDRYQLVILGAEIHSHVDHELVVRTNLYDALDYITQVENPDKRHKVRERAMLIPDNELPAAIKRRGTPLDPVITLIFNISGRPWNAPTALSQKYSWVDSRMRPFLNDYHMNVFSPSDFQDEDFSRFNTELGKTALLLKYRYDSERLARLVEDDSTGIFKNLQAANFACSALGLSVAFDNSKGGNDMSYAIRTLIDKYRQDGLDIGREEGIGIGFERGTLTTARIAMKKLHFTPEQTADFFEVPEKERETFIRGLATES